LRDHRVERRIDPTHCLALAHKLPDVSAFAEALEPEQRGSADVLVTAFETLADQLALDGCATLLGEIAAEVALADRTAFVEEALAAVLGATASARALAALAPMLTAAQASRALALIDQLPADQRTSALLAVLPARCTRCGPLTTFSSRRGDHGARTI
jgi:hypothetical protein